MKYYAIKTDSASLSYDERNEAKGILGRLQDSDDADVIGTATDISGAIREAKLHLFDNPDGLIYITDENNLVYGIHINEAVANTKSRYSGVVTKLVCNLFLFVTHVFFLSLLAYSISRPDLVLINLAIIGGALGIWWLLVSIKILNSIEATIIVLVLSVLVWLLYKPILA